MAEEQILSSEMVYEGRVVNLRVDTVTLGGERVFRREIIVHPGAVALVPVDEEQNVILVRQYRSGAGKEMLELPAGGLEPDEPLEECACRELQEEVGLYPDELIELGRLYVAASYTTEVITVYMAHKLRDSSQEGDIDEEITVVKMPFREALNMVLTNQIEDSKTIIGLVWAAQHLGILKI